MKLHRALLLALVLAVGGCGGGGGGNDTATPPGGGGGAGGGGGDGGGDGGGGGTSNGSAEILFPWTRASATAPTIVVRGTASDPDGVAAVIVNGVEATVTASASARGRLSKGNAAQTDVDWSAEIDLAKGDNVVEVTVEDEAGDVTESVDTSTITWVEVPFAFHLDAPNGRLVGLSYTLTASGYVQNIVQHDYVADEQTVFDTLFVPPSSTCFRAVEDELLFLSPPATNDWELRRYDLASRTEGLVAQLPASALDPGAGFDPVPIVTWLACDTDHTSAYVLVNYVDENGQGHSGSGFAKSRIVEIELATGTVTVLWETDLVESPRWIVGNMALADDRLVTMRHFDLESPLIDVSLADGTRSELAPGLEVSGVVLTEALDVGRVYIATMEGVDEIDVNGAVPTKQNISPVDQDHPLTFSEPRSIAFDPVNNRILVGDEALDTVVAIDLATGERSELVSRKVGQGTPLITPRSFAITADGSLAYVGDDGDNAPSRLYEVDLATGDRRIVGDISPLITSFVTGVALDEDAGQVYVAGPDVIVVVDLESEVVDTFVEAASFPAFPEITDVVLDTANGRLLVADAGSDGIHAVDLLTRDVTAASQPGVLGDGPAFGVVVSLTPAAADVLCVAGQDSELVTRVDLATGDREELVHGCDLGLASTFTGLDQVLFDPTDGRLIIKGDSVYSFDPGAVQCTRLPVAEVPLEFRVTSAGQLLGADFHALMQFDPGTGEIVVISK